ncbi:NAD-dependent epimerase/dehydratase family protein [Nesterenkonia alkaliphila]|uniref:NAD-dependent epimerase/dehydratase family protein n=1 Tax=Nesterenkonia alkaliphila TaxID=1463631 RepID=A0A7K1ULX9_9MICC|nr:NAD-dependent epimerase/dehydratase family protein [Nesterenkonia alkaliphila]MVT27332.1 NAD-dependent epimerase/dehydratase family protein [Nesterenkonia alkaliphila]GFZ80764.1 nucleoside-diphosphate sugar epimerase [Nesterenkonia alkaliphila]
MSPKYAQRITPGARVLVTGASGLLGRSVAARLAELGYQVSTLQRSPSGLSSVREVRGSLTDPDAVRAAVEGQDAVIHMAAKVSVSGRREEFEQVNIGGTERLLDAAWSAGVDNILYVSSPSVAHGGSSLVGVGAGPADPQRAEGHYAQTKAEAELIAESRAEVGMKVLVMRPHLVWGPGDGQLTKRIIDRAKSGRLPLLGTGAPLVDTLYIDNAVEAFSAGLLRLPSIAALPVEQRRLVVTNGEPRPIGELLMGIAAAGGAKPPRLRVPPVLAKGAGAAIEKIWAVTGPHADEPPMTKFLAEQLSTAHWFDQRHTQRVLDWKPSVSIDEGLLKLARHIRRTGKVV